MSDAQFRGICAYCGQPLILDGRNDCRHCGAPVPNSLRCAYCGGANSWVDMTCHKCGADISDQRTIVKFHQHLDTKTFTGALSMPMTEEIKKDCIVTWNSCWEAIGQEGDETLSPPIEMSPNGDLFFRGKLKFKY